MRAEKRCPTHEGGTGRVLPISAFHRDANALDGHQSRCKDCMNRMRRLRYAKSGPSERDRFSSLRSCAVRDGVLFDLSFEDWLELTALPCAYGEGKRPALSIGLDRKDPGGPYSRDNVVPCCARHNRIKSDLFGFESMLRIVREFAEAKACGDQFRRRSRKARSIT